MGYISRAGSDVHTLIDPGAPVEDPRNLTVQVKPAGQKETAVPRDTIVPRHLPVIRLVFMSMAVNNMAVNLTKVQCYSHSMR